MNEVKSLLVGLISFLVVQGFKLLGDWIKHDLSKVGAFMAYILTVGFIAGLDAALLKLPREYRELAEWIGSALVMVLSGSGAFRIYRNIKK